MGTIAPSVSERQQILELLPQEIMTDERYNVRPWSENEESEEKRIEELAATIERDGQLDAGIVVPVGEKRIDPIAGDMGFVNPEYILVAGHRRKKAIALINEKRDTNHQPLLRMRVVVDTSNPEALLRKAIISNLHRKDLSPMDKAAVIQRLRSEHGWNGFPGAKKVAEFLGVDVATVTQYEKFLKADKQIQNDLHSGKLSVDGAFQMLGVKPEHRDEVMERAELNQANAPEPKPKHERKNPKSTGETQSDEKPDTDKPIDGPSDGGRIKRPAITKAIRDVQESAEKPVTDAPIARNRRDFIEFFDTLDSPVYGYPDSAVRVWARYMVDKWAMGSGTDKTALAKFDEVSLKSSKGTRQDEDTKPKPKSLKSPRRDKGVKRIPVKSAKPSKSNAKSVTA